MTMVFYFPLLENAKLDPMGKNCREKNLPQYIEKNTYNFKTSKNEIV